MSSWKARAKHSMTWFDGSNLTYRQFFDKWAAYVKSDKARHAGYARADRSKYPEKHKKLIKLSYDRHADKRRAGARELREKIKADPIRSAKLREYFRKRAQRWTATKPGYLLRRRISTRIYMAINRKNPGMKSAGTMELIGCSISELKNHIEAQFQPGMTWDNQGKRGWHLDHKLPCASFDLSNPEQQKKCFHYTNLQPLWWYQNLSKGDKIFPA